MRVACRDAVELVKGHGERSTRSGTVRRRKAGGEVESARENGLWMIPVDGAKICKVVSSCVGGGKTRKRVDIELSDAVTVGPTGDVVVCSSTGAEKRAKD